MLRYGFSDSLFRIFSRNMIVSFAAFFLFKSTLTSFRLFQQTWINPKCQQIESRKPSFCNGSYQTSHFLSAAIPTLLADENTREYSERKYEGIFRTKIWGKILERQYEGIFQHENGSNNSAYCLITTRVYGFQENLPLNSVIEPTIKFSHMMLNDFM